MKDKLFRKDSLSFKDYALIGFALIAFYAGAVKATAKGMDLDDAADSGRETVRLFQEEVKETCSVISPNKENVEPNSKLKNLLRKKQEFMENQELEFKDFLIKKLIKKESGHPKKELQARTVKQVSFYKLTSKTTILMK